MQGTLDLVQAFGSMPATLYLCAAAYSTAGSGGLVSQAPSGNGNLNIESNEFFAVPVSSITDNNGNGVFDALDPATGFVVRGLQPSTGTGFTITWPAVPGRTYQVMTCYTIGGSWTNLSQLTTAGSGQGSLSYTDTTLTGVAQRFYKVRAINP
jgi:hypothetical protein